MISVIIIIIIISSSSSSSSSSNSSNIILIITITIVFVIWCYYSGYWYYDFFYYVSSLSFAWRWCPLRHPPLPRSVVVGSDNSIKLPFINLGVSNFFFEETNVTLF